MKIEKHKEENTMAEIIRCPNCGSAKVIFVEFLPGNGTRYECEECGMKITVPRHSSAEKAATNTFPSGSVKQGQS